MIKKTLLVLGAGKEQELVIRNAKRMGLSVVVSDYNNRAPAIKFADHFIKASVYDPQETLSEVLKFTKTIKIDGVIAVGVDAPLTVSVVAKALKLRSFTIKTSRLASNKILMKKVFKRHNIPTPEFSVINNLNHLKKFVLSQGNKKYVLKPSDSRGGRGVLFLNNAPSLEWAYKETTKHSRFNKVLIEEFLDGPQISTESFIINGKIYTPGLIDRAYPYLDKYAPFFIEAGGEQPTFLAQKVKKSVDRVLLKAAKALSIKTGFIKGDIVIYNGKPHIIEIAARLSGGYMSTMQIYLGTGVDILRAAIKYAIGDDIEPEKELVSKYQKGVAIRYWFPKPGRIVKINGQERIEKKIWVKLFQFNLQKGDIIEPPTDLTKRFGFVICEGRTRIEAVRRAEKALSLVTITCV